MGRQLQDLRNHSPHGHLRWRQLLGEHGRRTTTELLGLPTYKSVHMDSTITTGSEVLVVGDFSNYLIYDRIGVSLEYVQNVVDGSGIPTLQRGWVAHWRTGADVLNVDAFRTLRL